MNFSAMRHEPKSAFSYAYNNDTLHIRFKTGKNDVTKVEVLAVDPFNWVKREDDSGIYDFNTQSVHRIPMIKEQTTKYHDCWFAEITDIKWGRMKYCFALENEKEKYIFGSHDILPYTEEESVLYNLFNYYNYPYINEEDLYQAPVWVADTVWYQIFPERFHNGSPTDGRDVLPWGSEEEDGYHKKFGGNLLGVIHKLDYIKEAGFNGIYLTPIFESPSSHKYDTTDYFKIDPEFGDNETLGLLVSEAHKRGIRVMLDAVFNHCGFFHPFWQDVLEHGPESKYYDCFYILDPEKPIVNGEVKDGIPEDCGSDDLNYKTFAFTQMMPKWNTNHPIVREYLMNVATYWIENYKIDGWRLDVSNEVSHDFWREFRKCVKGLNQEVYILGENWDNSYPWLQGDQFDAVMNYEFSIAVWNYFRGGSAKEGVDSNRYTGADFKNAMSELLISYPRHLTKNLFNLLDSHDTERILTIVGGNIELLKQAYVFLMTYPGSPCIYYGSEIGMGGGEHSNRQCMIWEEEKQNKELFLFVKQLIKLRKEYECFSSVHLEWIAFEEEEGSDEDGKDECVADKVIEIESETLCYRKVSSIQSLYVFLHKSDSDITVKLPKELIGNECLDLLTGESEIVNESNSSIKLKAYGFKVLLVTRKDGVD